MRIGKQDAPFTAISTADAASITIRGRDLCNELIGKIDRLGNVCDDRRSRHFEADLAADKVKLVVLRLIEVARLPPIAARAGEAAVKSRQFSSMGNC